MNRLKNRIGMTMAELLIVVAIIVVLAGVAFIAVNNYQRSLGQLERDNIAKEIFVAAQNHLTVSFGEGYLGLTDDAFAFGKEDTISKDDNEQDIKDDYYFVVNGDIEDNTVLAQMLPFGSIDETIRAGGSYIIRYQKDAGLVLDVFYSTRTGSPSKFNHQFIDDRDGETYEVIMNCAGEANKSARRNYHIDGSVIGWYGGTEAEKLPTTELNTPIVKVVNKEKLYVEITDTNSENENASLRLVIEGKSSNAKIVFDLTPTSGGRVKYDSQNKKYTVTLDDITKEGMHFADININIANSVPFIPGENIKIYAVAYSLTALAKDAYSDPSTTNSLFEGIDDTDMDSDSIMEAAYIGNIRHLENLDTKVSKLGSSSGSLEKLNISKAMQTDDMNWVTFVNNTNGLISYWDNDGAATLTDQNCYYPISPDYSLSYNGQGHSISNVNVDNVAYAGLFGNTTSVSSVENLELIDFDISGTSSAGAMAGNLNNCTVKNVLARRRDNSTTSLEKKITAPVAGGLVGIVTNTNTYKIEYCAASVNVSGSMTNNGVAGGLIGTMSGNVTGCYSGGHTDKATYYSGGSAVYDNDGVLSNGIYSVTGYLAGGLIGNAGGSTINSCYSTCSVRGSIAGGFIGSGSGIIGNSYCTGLVNGITIGAFAGSYTGEATNCKYFSIINEIPPSNGSSYTYLLPVFLESGSPNDYEGITAFDGNAPSYNDFVGSNWKNAYPYDSILTKYYSGKYNLKTAAQLTEAQLDVTVPDYYYVNAHYGDWPAPEIFIINN